MSSIKTLNPKAEVLGKQAALFMNINAAKGLYDVMKTNLGERRWRGPARSVVSDETRMHGLGLGMLWMPHRLWEGRGSDGCRRRDRPPPCPLLAGTVMTSTSRCAGPKGTVKMLVGGAGGKGADGDAGDGDAG